MKKMIFEDSSNKRSEITDTDIPRLHDTLICGFPSYWRQGYWCCFEIFSDNIILKRLTVCFFEELGLYLNYEEMYDAIVGNVRGEKKQVRLSRSHLAVYDDTKLHETVDIDCELFVSKGLFMPPELAWKGIEYFIRTGEKSPELRWETPDIIPEDGNWC